MPDARPRPRPGDRAPNLVGPRRPRPLVPGGAGAQLAADDTPTDHSAAPLLGARFCRARPASSTTLVAAHRMRSSPACQAISNVDVFNVCTRWPVAGSVFSDIAVRLERWKGRAFGAAANSEGREVFMHSIVFFRPFAVIPRRSQFLGMPASAAILGVNHG